jgi:hypothetical protein
LRLNFGLVSSLEFWLLLIEYRLNINPIKANNHQRINIAKKDNSIQTKSITKRPNIIEIVKILVILPFSRL